MFCINNNSLFYHISNFDTKITIIEIKIKLKYLLKWLINQKKLSTKAQLFLIFINFKIKS